MPATLHMMCGKIAAGKSTLAAALSARRATVVMCEDQLLADLYGDQMQTGADFQRFSGKLRAAIGDHIVDLLNAGVSVVLDFQANTRASRTWMRDLLDRTEASHQLHVFDLPDAVLLDRLRARNASGRHAFQVTEAQFHAFAKHFEAPAPDEGFSIVRHENTDAIPT